jgi:hypothetical protein
MSGLEIQSRGGGGLSGRAEEWVTLPWKKEHQAWDRNLKFQLLKFGSEVPENNRSEKSARETEEGVGTEHLR